MGIPPVYDDAAFHFESLFRQFFAGTSTPTCAASSDASSCRSFGAESVASADSYEEPAWVPSSKPAAHHAAATGPAAQGPAIAAFRAAKWGWKRLVGGKSRSEAKARLIAQQTALLQLGQNAQEVRQEHATVLAGYRRAHNDCEKMHAVASQHLALRNRIVANMANMNRFDARYLESFHTADGEYRRLYPQVLDQQQVVLEYRRLMRTFVAEMTAIQAQARPILDAYAEDQAIYIQEYGRLPNKVSAAACLRAFFSTLPAAAAQDPLHFAMPPPESLQQPPPLFGGPRPAKPRPQRQPRPQRPEPRRPAPPPPVASPQQDVALGLNAAKRVEAMLGQIYSGDTKAWGRIHQGDLDAMQTALSQSSVRRGALDAAALRARRVIASIVLGNPDDRRVRQRYKRCQMTVHPDKTAGLPAAARAKANALCKLLSAAVDVLTA